MRTRGHGEEHAEQLDAGGDADDQPASAGAAGEMEPRHCRRSSCQASHRVDAGRQDHQARPVHEKRPVTKSALSRRQPGVRKQGYVSGRQAGGGVVR